MIQIDLSSAIGDGLEGMFLIIAKETGVTYTNQCGGTATAQQSLEGFLVPLYDEYHDDTWWSPDIDPDPLEDFYRADHSKIQLWLNATGLCRWFKPPSPDFTVQWAGVHEAWIPIKVRDESDINARDAPHVLKAVRGMTGVLTYMNSD